MLQSRSHHGIDYRTIKFGYASAEKEGAEEPRLLLKGYYNLDGIAEEVLRGPRSIVLGYKGSGKSAIGQRLKLLAAGDPQLFVRATFVGDFPFSHFRRIVPTTGATDPEAMFPSVWAWVLLMELVNSFADDEGAFRSAAFDSALGTLRKLGFLPAKSLRHLVVNSAKTSVQAALPAVFTVGHEAQRQVADNDFSQYVDHIKDLLSTFRSSSRHLIIIDGLDDILTLKNIQYQVLAALVYSVDRLNDFLRVENLPAKLVLLCRTDLFTRLPGANKNKIRQDSALDIDWYHDPRDPGESHLIRLANLRAQLAYPRLADMFAGLFPQKVYGRDARQTLLENTRHTPRDLLQLLAAIQKYAEVGPLAHSAVASGMRDFSVKYFLPEIRDELVGHASASECDTMFALLGSVRSREFRFDELEARIQPRHRIDDDFDVGRMLELLFECSAVGNVDPSTGYFYFKYRNRHSTLSFEDKIVIHPGLWKALNVA